MHAPIIATYNTDTNIPSTSNTNTSDTPNTIPTLKESLRDTLLDMFDSSSKPDEMVIKYCKEGKLEEVKYLIEVCGVNPYPHYDREAGLVQAARSGHLGVVKYLVSRHKANDKEVYCYFNAGFIAAAIAGRLQIVEYLWSLLEDNDSTRFAMRHALKGAALEGRLDVVQYLCSMSEDYTPLKVKQEALVEALKTTKVTVVDYLLDFCGKGVLDKEKDEEPMKVDPVLKRREEEEKGRLVKVEDTFIQYCREGNLKKVEGFRMIYTDTWLQPGCRDNEAIIRAAEGGHYDVVKHLCKFTHGYIGRVNPAARDNLAIVLAAKNGRFDTLKYLCGRSDTNPGDRNNEAILEACIGGHTDVVRCLISYPKVDPFVNENLPLTYAAKGGHLDIVKLLCWGGADPKACNYRALKAAIDNGHKEVALFLLNGVADS